MLLQLMYWVPALLTVGVCVSLSFSGVVEVGRVLLKGRKLTLWLSPFALLHVPGQAHTVFCVDIRNWTCAKALLG